MTRDSMGITQRICQIQTHSSAVAERQRKLRDFRGWVTMRQNFRLKGYISRQYLWTVR